MQFHFDRLTHRLILVGIFVAALVVRLAAIAWFHPPMISDDIEYVALAKSLAEGRGYELEGKPTAYRPPGYPVFLALIFKLSDDSLVAVRITQMIADLLSCFLVFLLGRKLFSERVGVIAAGIFALFPAQILYVSYMMTETVFTTLLLLFLWLCVNNEVSQKNNIVVGIVVGAGTLMRPIMMLLPAIIFFIRWRGGLPFKNNFKLLAVMCFTALVILSPWLIRNYQQFDRLTITSNSGVNFWMGNHSGASGSYSFPKENNPLSSVEDEFERSDLGIQLGKTFILEHPDEYGMILARKWAFFFSVDYWLLLGLQYQPDYRDVSSAALVMSRFSPSYVLVVHVPFAFILLFATFGFVCHAPQNRQKLILLLAPCAYWLVVHLAFYSAARYRFPIVPLLMIASAYGVDMLARKTYSCTRLRATVLSFFVLLFVGGWIAEYVLIQAKSRSLSAATGYAGQLTLTPKMRWKFQDSSQNISVPCFATATRLFAAALSNYRYA